jgi:hypothetical protein
MEARSFAEMIQTFGLATAMLIVMGIFLWRLLGWIKPWAEKGMEAHLRFIAKTAETNEKLSDTLESTRKTIAELALNEQKALVNHEKLLSMEQDQNHLLKILVDRKETT